MKALIQSAVVVVLIACCYFSGLIDSSLLRRELPTQSTTVSSSESGDAIRVATFNIQVFGVSKLGKPNVMKVLAQTVRQFDVVAIQEIRSKDTSVLPRFVDMINSDGSEYAFTIGPRLGRTSSKEQYAFVYNLRTIELIAGSTFTVQDPQDLLHREPYVARFRVRGPPTDQATTFTLINIHTDPDEVGSEINALDDVLAIVRESQTDEDDVLLLGDLNANERKFGELGLVPNLNWVVRDQPTNTRLNKTYDNILFDEVRTTEFTGAAGVLNLMEHFNLTTAEALQVSDHMPVWMELRKTETRTAPALATSGSSTPR